jgi:hypothetical protein
MRFGVFMVVFGGLPFDAALDQTGGDSFDAEGLRKAVSFLRSVIPGEPALAEARP